MGKERSKKQPKKHGGSVGVETVVSVASRESQGRGQLTQRIKDKSKQLLGYEIDQTELRLMPYIMYVMVNEQRIDPNKISGEERKILSKYRNLGYIEGGASGMQITKDFWFILAEIVMLGYVDID